MRCARSFARCPRTGDIRARCLQEVGCPCTPREIGVDKALLKQTFMYCKEIRARYTVFQTVYDLGLLDELSDRVIAKTETL